MDFAKTLHSRGLGFRKEKEAVGKGLNERTAYYEARLEELQAKLEELSETFTKIEAENLRLQEEVLVAEQARLQNALYRLVAGRYSDFIEKNEVKNVQDLKESVQPNNSHVVELAQRFKEYARGDEAFRQAYAFVRDEIGSVPNLGFSFWLSIKEMLESRVADHEDKAILLCSLFKALGAESNVAIAELSDGSHRPLVFLLQRTRYVLCDPNSKQQYGKFAGSKDAVLRQYSFEDNRVRRVLYEFNDLEYVQNEEE